MSHRSLYTLLLIAAALVEMGCSALGGQPPGTAAAVPASTVTSAAPATGGNTSLLGGIGPENHAPPPPPLAIGTAGAAAAAGHNGATTSKAAQAQAQAQAAQELAAQCSDLRQQMRGEQATERAAPSTSIDEDIVNATIAKADKRIDRLQQQYDQLGCPDSLLPSAHQRVPLLPPAPGALPP